jgi:hypothetical protein
MLCCVAGKRVRILKDGQLSVMVYGANEALLWAQRIAGFQMAMRGVLGDRRRKFFWSGSVLDSVVGAILTQNVADTLSSKAFMEMASRWPAKGGAGAGALLGAGHEGVGGEQGSGGAAKGCASSVDWEAVRLADVSEVRVVIFFCSLFLK